MAVVSEVTAVLLHRSIATQAVSWITKPSMPSSLTHH
jgi:hypothetical protein